MKILFSLLLITASHLTLAHEDLCTPEVQHEVPYAFALNRESMPFHSALSQLALKERSALIKKIKENPFLVQQIQNYPKLTLKQQEYVLNQVFISEVQVLKMRIPTLILGPGPGGRSTFFEFDPNIPLPGKVYIDFKRLKETDHPYASLALLIHETRHSAQLQLSQVDRGPLGQGYAEAFIFQHELFQSGRKISFCNFASLLNEYEAFQFANYVLFELTDGQVSIEGMGTAASSYDQRGNLIVDLLRVMRTSPEHIWFEQMNRINQLVKLRRSRNNR